jgi:hypothetical protein
VEDPARKAAQPELMLINVRRSGALWSVAGEFGKDKQGHIYYLHHPRPREVDSVIQRYQGQRIGLEWGNDRTTMPFIVGRLDDERFIG